MPNAQLRDDIVKVQVEHSGSKLKARDYVNLIKGDRWQSIKEKYGAYIDDTKQTQNQKRDFMQAVARLFELPTNSHGGKRYGMWVSVSCVFIFESLSDQERSCRRWIPTRGP